EALRLADTGGNVSVAAHKRTTAEYRRSVPLRNMGNKYPAGHGRTDYSRQRRGSLWSEPLVDRARPKEHSQLANRRSGGHRLARNASIACATLGHGRGALRHRAHHLDLSSTSSR